MKTKAMEIILKNTTLATQVKSLPLGVITKLVEHVGLEDAGPIIALTTTEQFQAIVDSDMWALQMGGVEEGFSSERFLTWIEVLSELGDKSAAEKLMALDDDLLTTALSETLQVFDTEELSSVASLNEDSFGFSIEAHLKRSEYVDIDRYVIVFKKSQSSTALSDILIAWSGIDHSHFCSILDRCVLYTLDHSTEMDISSIERQSTAREDALDARNSRRTEIGYVSRSDALSFLNLARTRSSIENYTGENNPIYRSYLRQYKSDQKDSFETLEIPEVLSQSILNLLDEVFKPETPNPQNILIDSKQPQTPTPDMEFSDLMLQLQQEYPTIYQSRLSELAFLGNTLIAGCSMNDRSLRAVESVQIAYSTCRLGIEHILSEGGLRWSNNAAANVLQGRDCITLFEVGWHLIYQKVSRSALEALTEKLEKWSSTISKAPKELLVLLLEFQKCLQQDKPWEARNKTAWLIGRFGQNNVAILQAYLDECPHHVTHCNFGHTLQEKLQFFGSLEDVAKATEHLVKLKP